MSPQRNAARPHEVEWTAGLVDSLRRLWAADHSASHIADVLGLTKNQVIGKARRLRLHARPNPVRNYEQLPPPTEGQKDTIRKLWATKSHKFIAEQTGLSRQRVARTAEEMGLPNKSSVIRMARAKTEKSKPKGLALPKPKPRPLPLSRHRTCQYIEGEPSVDDSCKCGKPAQVGSSYCPPHTALCTKPTKRECDDQAA